MLISDVMAAPVAAPKPFRQPPNPVLRLQNIHKYYDMGEIRVHALRGVTLQVAAGEFVVVMGSSGSGKSTLMNIIGCLDRPSSGQYRLRGRDISQLDSCQLAGIRSRELGFVFQNYNLVARKSALENVALPTLYTKLGRRAGLNRAAEGLALVGLTDRAHHYPSQMSGGQQQRVAIARALVNQPSILLADEPTGSLDSGTSLEIMGLFRNLNTRGLTIVMVTHETWIAQFGSRIVVFRDGQIQKDEKRAI